MDIRLLMLLFLILLCGVLLATVFGGPSASRSSGRRLADIQGRHSGTGESSMELRMRKAISNRTAEKHQLLVSLVPNPENLAKRIQMTGRKWTLSQYMMTCLGITILVFAILKLRDFSLVASILVATASGFGLPHMVTGRMISKRINKFTSSFPDALDLLVRGLRPGRPISETLGVVPREVPGPVGEEFRMITERVKIGKSMEQS